MIKKLRKKCQWENCQEEATCIAANRNKIGCYCYKHGYNIAKEHKPEYLTECPNCDCIFGVN